MKVDSDLHQNEMRHFMPDAAPYFMPNLFRHLCLTDSDFRQNEIRDMRQRVRAHA